MGEIKQIDEQQMGELIRMNRHLSQLQQPDVDAICFRPRWCCSHAGLGVFIA